MVAKPWRHHAQVACAVDGFDRLLTVVFIRMTSTPLALPKVVDLKYYLYNTSCRPLSNGYRTGVRRAGSIAVGETTTSA